MTKIKVNSNPCDTKKKLKVKKIKVQKQALSNFDWEKNYLPLKD